MTLSLAVQQTLDDIRDPPCNKTQKVRTLIAKAIWGKTDVFFVTKQTWNHLRPALKAVALPRGHLSLKLRPRTGLCDRWVMVGWQQQICLRVRREPGKEHLALSIGIPSTPLCFSYHHSDIYYNISIYYNIVIIIDGFLLYDFQWKTRDTSVKMLVTSRELCSGASLAS